MSSDDDKSSAVGDARPEKPREASTDERQSKASAAEPPQHWEDPVAEFLGPVSVWVAAVLWIALCTVFVYGLVEGIAVYFGLVIAGGLLLGVTLVVVVMARYMGLWWLPALLFALPPIVWFFVGHYNGWRDYLILTVILITAGTLGGNAIDKIVARTNIVGQKGVKNVFQVLEARTHSLLGLRRSEKHARRTLQVIQAGTYLLLVWAVSSLADHFMGPFWTPQSPTLQELTRSQAIVDESGQQSVAVALSGGGYRAAIMHAGVLDALEQSEVRITALSSVSGGSIIGGFYALGGTPQRFVETILERRFNLYKDLLGIHNLLRLPKPGRITFAAFGKTWSVPVLPVKSDFTRTDVLAEQFERVLFGEATLSDVRRSGLLWVVGTTDLLTGDAVGVSTDGIYRRALPVLEENDSVGYLPRKHNPPSFEQAVKIQPDSVSQIVAASSAFPGAFAPVALEYDAAGDQPAVKFLLADGGVTDNSGLALLLAAWKEKTERSDPTFDVVIASNGGKGLQSKGADEQFSRPFRALDVIYAASGVYVPEAEGRENSGPKIIALTPERTLPSSSRVVRAMIDWAARDDDDRGPAPIQQAQLHRALEQEISDQILDRVELITPREDLSQSWQLVVQESDVGAFDDERMLRRLDVVLDFIHAARVFEDTSTLSDTLPKEDVEALFRLGQYLVFLKENIGGLTSD